MHAFQIFQEFMQIILTNDVNAKAGALKTRDWKTRDRKKRERIGYGKPIKTKQPRHTSRC